MMIDRISLAEMCLRDLRQWPGCEDLRQVGILSGPAGSFRVRIVDYGSTRKKLADRAALCVERETRRYYRLTNG
jgi:hypothetical protein